MPFVCLCDQRKAWEHCFPLADRWRTNGCFSALSRLCMPDVTGSRLLRAGFSFETSYICRKVAKTAQSAHTTLCPEVTSKSYNDLGTFCQNEKLTGEHQLTHRLYQNLTSLPTHVLSAVQDPSQDTPLHRGEHFFFFF